MLHLTVDNHFVYACQQQYHIWSILRPCRHHVPRRQRWQSCGRRGPATSTRPSGSAIRWNTSLVTTMVEMRAESGGRDPLWSMPAMHSRSQLSWTYVATLSTSSESCRYCASGNRMYVASSVLRVDRSGPSVTVHSFCCFCFVLWTVWQ